MVDSSKPLLDARFFHILTFGQGLIDHSFPLLWKARYQSPLRDVELFNEITKLVPSVQERGLYSKLVHHRSEELLTAFAEKPLWPSIHKFALGIDLQSLEADSSFVPFHVDHRKVIWKQLVDARWQLTFTCFPYAAEQSQHYVLAVSFY